MVQLVINMALHLRNTIIRQQKEQLHERISANESYAYNLYLTITKYSLLSLAVLSIPHLSHRNPPTFNKYSFSSKRTTIIDFPLPSSVFHCNVNA